MTGEVPDQPSYGSPEELDIGFWSIGDFEVQPLGMDGIDNIALRGEADDGSVVTFNLQPEELLRLADLAAQLRPELEAGFVRRSGEASPYSVEPVKIRKPSGNGPKPIPWTQKALRERGEQPPESGDERTG